MLDLAYVEPESKRIGDDEQIKQFIAKMEAAVDRYPTHEKKPTTPEAREKLVSAQKAARELWERLLHPGDTLEFLENCYVQVEGFPLPDRERLINLLTSLGVAIDVQLEMLEGKRKKKIPEAVHHFTAELAALFYFTFDQYPSITSRKPNSDNPQLESPFVLFLDHALQAIDFEIKDPKFLIKSAIKRFRSFHDLQLALSNHP